MELLLQLGSCMVFISAVIAVAFCKAAARQPREIPEKSNIIILFPSR